MLAQKNMAQTRSKSLKRTPRDSENGVHLAFLATMACNVKIDFLDDKDRRCCYEGELSLDNQISGRGRMEYKSGIVFSGEFTCGKRNGQGLSKHRDGRSWEGTFANDIFKKGKYNDANWEYEGEFNERGFHGQGLFKHRDGHFREGTWENNILKKGVYKYENYEYEGGFDGWRSFDGQGLLKHCDGRSWEGIWENNILKTGTFKSPKYEYKGEFNEKGFHGKGLQKYNFGLYREGTFEDSIFKKGTVKSASMVYEGECNEKGFYGKGLLKCSGGRTWKGFFENNRFMKGEYTGLEIEKDTMLHKDGFLRGSGSIQRIDGGACKGTEKHFEVTNRNGEKYNLRAEWLHMKRLWKIEAGPLVGLSGELVLQCSSDKIVEGGVGAEGGSHAKKRKFDGDDDNMDAVWDCIYAIVDESQRLSK